ncbi:FMN-binding protein [Dactylosporangium sp. NPDC049525]|uniref:FMN-binding protein n=1 Tax=Dactylosporangium sp. NPDC049525 TaxID=3154730 RepID=UPI0034436FAA
MRRIGFAVLGTGVVTAVLIAVKSQLPPVSVPGPAASAPATAARRPSGPSMAHAPAVASQAAPGVGVVDPSRMMDGSYLGAVVTNPYGPVQVRVDVRGGRLVDVVAVRLPTAAARGIEIGMRATPVLREQALERQSADLDTVSGATYTSDGYRRSLQSALDAARSGRPGT